MLESVSVGLVQLVIITAMFIVSSLILYVSNRAAFLVEKPTDKIKIFGIFILFFIINIILVYFPEKIYIYANAISWPIVATYIFTRLRGGAAVTSFLRKICIHCEEKQTDVNTDLDEKNKAQILSSELRRIIVILTAHNGWFFPKYF